MAGVYYTVMDRRSALSMLLAVPALTLANRVEAKPIATFGELDRVFTDTTRELHGGNDGTGALLTGRQDDAEAWEIYEKDGKWYRVLHASLWRYPEVAAFVTAYVFFEDRGEPINEVEVQFTEEPRFRAIGERLARRITNLGTFEPIDKQLT